MRKRENSDRERRGVDTKRELGHAACGRRRSGESGFAYVLALALVAVVVILSGAVLERATAREQREREQEMIWRGNQYSRAIRLYFRKVGRYPQSVDDLMKGVPGVRFLREEYNDPMNKEDGSWRFIYLNQAGQIIGSTRYASLQQMALMDTLGMQPGAVPQGAPGQPGTPAASLADSDSENSGASTVAKLTGRLPPALPYHILISDNEAAEAQAYYSSLQAQLQTQPSTQSTTTSLDDLGVQLTPEQESALNSALGEGGVSSLAEEVQSGGLSSLLSQAQSSGLSSVLSQAQSSGLASSFGQSSSSAFGNSSDAFGSSQPQQQGSTGMSPIGTGGANVNALAALNSGILQQKPTGPVDGPVLGGFLTGVGSKVDKRSVIWYHGAKKYSDWEFIWNPLEDQAAAAQQQLNQAAGAGASTQGGLPVANPFGGSTTSNPNEPGTNSPTTNSPNSPNFPSENNSPPDNNSSPN